MRSLTHNVYMHEIFRFFLHFWNDGIHATLFTWLIKRIIPLMFLLTFTVGSVKEPCVTSWRKTLTETRVSSVLSNVHDQRIFLKPD